MHHMISTSRLLAFSATLACFASGAIAHTVWLEPVGQGVADYRVMFGGHAGKLETYTAQKLKEVKATDKQGKDLAVTRDVTADGVRLHVAGAPAMIAMHFDNGIHTRPPSGPSVEKPMNEVPGATRATYAVKYHKTIVDWSPLVTKTINQPFEVVALDAAAPVADKPLRVRVLQDGKPVAGVKLGRGEEGTATDPVTDADGIASFVPRAGFNKLWAGKRIPVAGNPQYTELSYEYLFGFHAK
jgi:nickel transport protein